MQVWPLWGVCVGSPSFGPWASMPACLGRSSLPKSTIRRVWVSLSFPGLAQALEVPLRGVGEQPLLPSCTGARGQSWGQQWHQGLSCDHSHTAASGPHIHA